MYSHIQIQNTVKSTFFYMLALMTAVLAGLIASTGNILIVSFFFLFITGLILLGKPNVLLFLVLLGGLVATGVSQLYLPQIQIIRWAISAITIILGGMAIIFHYMPNGEMQRRKTSGLSRWLLIFFVLSLFTAFVNSQDIGTLVVGFKGYYQVWGLFIALMLMRWSPDLMRSIPKFIIGLAFLQLPFAIHQYLFIVPKRVGLGHGVIPEDVIAGTFGASLTGGGSNAALSAFLITALAIIMSYWKRGLISISQVGIASLLLLMPVMVNLSKVSLVYLLLIAIVIFKDDISKSPGKFIAGSFFTVVFMAAIISTYSFIQSDSRGGQSFQEFINKSIESNISEGAGHGGYDLNRWTSITYWAREQYRSGDIAQTLIGHGLGEARSGSGGAGFAGASLAQTKYAYMGIGLTSISALLWEAGILGLILILGVFISAYRTAARLAIHFSDDPKMSATFHGLQAGVAVLLLSLSHKNLFVFDLPYQTFVMLILGYIAYWDVQAKSTK